MTDDAPLDEVGEIFGLAVEVIEDSIGDLKAAAKVALDHEQFDKVGAETSRVAELRNFQAEVRELLQRWAALRPPAPFDAEVDEGASTRAYLGRVERGSRTPEPAFRVPILTALVEAGGSLTMRETLDRVAEILVDELNEVDRQTLPSDDRQIRWRNTAQWARNNLADEGLLDRSTRGVWAITDAGRAWLEERR